MFEVEILKEANEKYLKEINALAAQLSLTGTPPKPLGFSELKQMLDQKNFYPLVVRDQDRIIALAILYFTQLPTGLIAEAEDLIVDEKYRKWGVGPALINSAAEMAEKAGAKHLSLRTNPKRIEANKMYQEMGFFKMETNFYRINLPRK